MSEQLLTWVFKILVLVWQMRRSQKAYFTEGRRREDLFTSKQLEAEVDKALKRHLKFGANGEPIDLVLDDEGQADEPAQERLFQ